MSRIFVVLEMLLPVAFFLTIMGIVLTAQINAKKRKTNGRSQRPQTKPTPAGRSPLGDHPGRLAATHDHIKSTELPHDRKMEQLRTLKEAGLLTQEEYDERYQKIMRSR